MNGAYLHQQLAKWLTSSDFQPLWYKQCNTRYGMMEMQCWLSSKASKCGKRHWHITFTQLGRRSESIKVNHSEFVELVAYWNNCSMQAEIQM